MPLNNQPKLKQIQGGLQVRQDVDKLLPLLLSYQASKVTTGIEKVSVPGTYYTAEEILNVLLATSNEHGSNISSLSTAVNVLQTTPISDYVRVTGSATTVESTPAVYDTDGITVITPAVFTTTISVNGNISELVPNMQSVLVNAYTMDNKPLVNSAGTNVSFNVLTQKFSSVPCIADYSGEEIAYVPQVGTYDFKFFPVGSYTLGNIPQDFILDNEEMNLIYYSNAIDLLAFDLSKNTDLINHVQQLVGETSVTQALNEVTSQLQSQINAVVADVAELNGDATVVGSVDSKVKAAADALQAQVDSLDTRTDNTEAAIAVLNGDSTVAGSVAKQINDAVTVINGTTTSLGNRVSVLEGGSDTVGSVAYSVKTAIDPLTARVVSLETATAADRTDINLLKADENIVGSVANSIKTAITNLNTQLTAVDTSLQNQINAITGGNTVDNIAGLKSAIIDLQNRATTDEGDITSINTSLNSTIEQVNTNTTDLSILKGAETIVGSVDNKIHEATVPIYELIEEESTKVRKVETIAVNTTGQTTLVFGKIVPSNYSLTSDVVKLYINGLVYVETAAFIVSRVNKVAIWTLTSGNGGFDLDADDLVQIEFTMYDKSIVSDTDVIYITNIDSIRTSTGDVVVDPLSYVETIDLSAYPITDFQGFVINGVVYSTADYITFNSSTKVLTLTGVNTKATDELKVINGNLG